MTIQGAPEWVELYVPDVAKAQRFYGELFGWRLEDMGDEYGNYHLIMLGDEIAGGAMRTSDDMGPPSWCVYLATDDIEATTRKVRENGGEVVVEPMELPNGGTMAFYLDNTGAAVGAWHWPHAEPMMQARDKLAAPSWYELMTNDYEASKSFYVEVFGWQLSAMGEQGVPYQYSSNGADDAAVAGICDASEFIPSQVPQSFWRAYFTVEDTDAALVRVAELGGSLVDGPQESPWGIIASVADDQGVHFQLID